LRESLLMMRAAMFICLVVSTALAQDPAALFEKAPPDIDEALRARVTQFYQAHQEGKFRAADLMVAEDSKEAFFGMDKPRCRVFAIGSVKYSDNFTRAQVMISCDTEMMMMTGRIPIKRPLSSKWKIADGQWFWYIDPPTRGETVTPFGISKPQEPGKSSAPPDLRGLFVDVGAVTKSVKADKTQFTFDPNAAAADQVALTNQMPGSVTLAIEAREAPGLTFKLDRTTLNRGERAVLRVQYEPVQGRPPSATTVQIVVSPTDQVIPVKVLFSPAAAGGRAN
jgi:hypothetical protein